MPFMRQDIYIPESKAQGGNFIMRGLRYIGGIVLGSIGLYTLIMLGKLVYQLYPPFVMWYGYTSVLGTAVVGIACIWQACRLFRKPKKIRRVSQ